MIERAAFHLLASDGRWTASAGQQFRGHDVAYGGLGKVGYVERAVVVDSGRALRLHVVLTRHIANPDRRKFSLHTAPKRSRARKRA